MKTKFFALALLAGGSIFAQTRFSTGENFGGTNRGVYAPAPPQATHYAPSYSYRDDDDRHFDRDYHHDRDRHSRSRYQSRYGDDRRDDYRGY